MTKLQRKNLAQPDDARALGRGHLELVEIGDAAIGRVTYEPGWRWSEDVKPLVETDLCDVHHVGFVLSGRLVVEMADGTMLELRQDDAFEIPPGHDAWVVGAEPWVAIDSRGRRYFGTRPEEAGHRVLGTILFTDIVASTATVARLGDVAWRGVLAELNEHIRALLERYHGREVQTTGDGVLAVFTSPDDAVRCASAMLRAARDHGLRMRAGLHTGEYQPAGEEIRGIAVHVAARVMSTARDDEVRITAATAALLDRGAYVLEACGSQPLKGIEDPVELFALVG